MFGRLIGQLESLYTDDLEYQRARALGGALLAALAGLTLYTANLILAVTRNALSLLTIFAGLVAAAAIMGAGWLLLQGRLRAATWVTVGGIWLFSTLVTMPFGITFGWPTALLALMALASLFLPRIEMLMLTGLMTLSVLGIGLAQAAGIAFTAPTTGDELILHGGAVLTATLVTGLILAGHISRAHSAPLEISRHLNALLAVSRVATSNVKPDNMLGLAVEHIREEFGFRLVQVFLVDQQTSQVTLHSSTGADTAGTLGRVHRSVAQAVAGHKMVVVSGYRANQPYSEMAVPITAGGKLLGVLAVQSYKEGGFSESEITAMQLLTNQLALFMSRPQLIPVEIVQADIASPLFQVAHQIATATESDVIVEALRSYVLQDADWISLVRVDFGAMGEPVTKVAAYWDRDGLKRSDNLPESVRRLVAHKRVIVANVANLGEEQIALKAYAERTLQVSGVAIFPLTGRDRTAGYLVIGNRKPREYSDREIQILQLLSGQIATVIENLSLLDALSRQTERLALINRLSQAVAGTLNIEALGRLVATELSRVFDMTHLSFVLYQPNQPMLRLVNLFGAPVSEQFQLAGSVVEQALIGHRMLRIATLNSSYTDSGMWSGAGVDALIVVPVTARGGWLGTLNVGVEDLTRMGDDEVSLCEQAAAQMAIALENHLLFERLEVSLKETTTLYSTALAVNAARSLEEVYTTGLTEMAHLSRADRVVLYLAGPDPRVETLYVEQVAVWQNGEVMILSDKPRLSIFEAPILSQFPQSRSNLIFNSVRTDRRLDPKLHAMYAEAGVNALLMIPLSTGATWLGALLFEAKGNQTFTGEQVRLCRSIADQVALAIDSQLLLNRTRLAARREQLLREITEQIRRAEDPETILRVAEAELTSALGKTPEELRSLPWRDELSLSTEEWDLIENVYSQVQLAIENLNLIKEAQRTARREQIVSNITARLQRSSTVDDVLRAAVRELRPVLDDYHIRLHLTPPGRTPLESSTTDEGEDEK